ncbi:MAG: hypothetical protein AAF572_09725 [Cyanobacteria bacterium P01_B01_bin.77]
MLKTTQLKQRSSTLALIEVWANRYKLDASKLVTECTGDMLMNAIDEEGRQQTADKVHKWIKISSELAGLKTNSLFAYAPNVVSLEDARRISEVVKQIYTKLLDIYQQQQAAPPWSDLINTLNTSDSAVEKMSQVSAIDLFVIQQIADEVEPLILELQNQHLASTDRRTIGFMSTQFHFSTQVLYSYLQPIEQILLQPYLHFVEEQVCIPWQRICAAASRHTEKSPTLEAVKLMLLQSEEISDITYRQTVERLPKHHSRRGIITQPDVTASYVRDINMFQAYLWLSVLEGNTTSIKNELLPLCIMVFPAVSVDWQLVETGIELMMDCIQERLDTERFPLIRSCMTTMKQLFANPQDASEFLEIQ